MSYADQSLMEDGKYAGDERQVAEASASTILDRLNEDCWRVVLDHVPVEDIIRSERVCRRWQAIVHRYFQDVGLCFMSSCHPDEFVYLDPVTKRADPTMLKVHPKNRTHVSYDRRRREGAKDEKLEKIVDKWGLYMVHWHCAGNNEGLVKTARTCPNLKSLAVDWALRGCEDLSPEMVEFVEKLERIALLTCTASDRSLGEMADSEYRQILFEFGNNRDGQIFSAFWPNFKPTNLRSLTLRGIYDFRYFLSAVECYPNLTELILQGEMKNAHLLFEKMPKLERLHLIECWTDNKWIENIPDHVCNGLQLKQLVVWHSPIGNDWSKDLLTRCRGLQYLDIGCMNTNLRFYHSATVMPVEISPFMKELCQAHGPTLTDIRLLQITLSDDDLVSLIRFCPNLTYLEIRICIGLSDAFLKKVAIAARRWQRWLTVYIGGYNEDYIDILAQASYPEVSVRKEPPVHYGGCTYETEASYPGLYVEFENPRNTTLSEYEASVVPKQYIWFIMTK